MESYKKLFSNSIIFAIGNLGSKLIAIILVPIYTYHLTTTEYGLVDIVITTSNMLLPLVSLSIFESVLRFTMDREENNKEVFTNGLLITVAGSLIAIMLYPLLTIFFSNKNLLIYMLIILILQAFQNLLTQFVRAIGMVRIYALNGILMTLVVGITGVYLLVFQDKGVNGYLQSIVIGNIVSILFLACFSKVFSYFEYKLIKKSLVKKMIQYSIPLIPNAFMWWIMNASSRFFIVFFVSASANGLFAVANKIPSLLSILSNIFFQAWQLSAIEEYDAKKKEVFYSNVFSYFSMIMLIGTSAILLILKPLIKIAMSAEYYDSWKFVPFLLLGVVFSSFSSFLGTNYVAAKETNGVFKTSVVGGIVNIVINIILIPFIGAIGASISTMISFFFIWLIRVKDTKKYVQMNIDKTNVFFNLCIIFIQIVVLYFNLGVKIEFLIESILFACILLVNRTIFSTIIKKIKLIKK